MRRAVQRQWSSLMSAGDVIRPGTGPELIEFADYECPYCRNQQDVIELFLRLHPTVQYRLVQFPLDSHPFAAAAAAAAICGWRHGNGPDMHRFLFAEDDWQSSSFPWVNLPERVGARNDPDYRACLNDGQWRPPLDAGVALGHSLGVGGTPTFASWHGGLMAGVATVGSLERFLGM